MREGVMRAAALLRGGDAMREDVMPV